MLAHLKGGHNPLDHQTPSLFRVFSLDQRSFHAARASKPSVFWRDEAKHAARQGEQLRKKFGIRKETEIACFVSVRQADQPTHDKPLIVVVSVGGWRISNAFEQFRKRPSFSLIGARQIHDFFLRIKFE